MNSHILPTLAFFAAIGIFFVYVGPTWTGTIATTKAAIALDDQALAAASEYSAQQNTLASSRSAIDPTNLAKLSTLLPDSVDNVSLILDLNALAARSGLSLANIDVVTEEASGAKNSKQGTLPVVVNPVGSINLSLSATGTFSSLQAFLVGVEKSARLLDVQDIAVKGSDTGVYTYQMTLRLYWLRQ